jgi:hypothetical protein
VVPLSVFWPKRVSTPKVCLTYARLGIMDWIYFRIYSLHKKWGQKINPRFVDVQWLSLENPTNTGFDAIKNNLDLL